MMLAAGLAVCEERERSESGSAAKPPPRETLAHLDPVKACG